MSGSAWDCDRGYVAFLKMTYPLSPSGLMDGAMGYVAFLKVSLPSSGRARVGRRRRGGESSQQQQGARRAEETGR
ncbi:hypothetical protein Taro_015076 [Colocasia esculenta]|uniref:Uncharacterized protein n=1 Tax=Colocasia esculenta TaxID=4460 RepID=A0A843UJX3_COLES|nr:hypothetical protein [Colocasia esculenta]